MEEATGKRRAVSQTADGVRVLAVQLQVGQRDSMILNQNQIHQTKKKENLETNLQKHFILKVMFDKRWLKVSVLTTRDLLVFGSRFYLSFYFCPKSPSPKFKRIKDHLPLHK